MERISDREWSRRLRGFETVWKRVGAAKAPEVTAEQCGVKLMPRRNCRCRPRRS